MEVGFPFSQVEALQPLLDVCLACAATPHGALCLLVTSIHLETSLASCDTDDTMLTTFLGWGGQKLTRSTDGLPTDPPVRRCREAGPLKRVLGSPGWAMFNAPASCVL